MSDLSQNAILGWIVIAALLAPTSLALACVAFKLLRADRWSPGARTPFFWATAVATAFGQWFAIPPLVPLAVSATAFLRHAP